MQDLPDAPWIRDAELNGYPSPDPVCCPVCGDEANSFYLQDGIVSREDYQLLHTKFK